MSLALVEMQRTLIAARDRARALARSERMPEQRAHWRGYADAVNDAVEMIGVALNRNDGQCGDLPPRESDSVADPVADGGLGVSGKVAEILFPPEWLAGRSWLICEIVEVIKEESTGRRMYTAGGVLDDGTNLIGLAWDGGGQNVARSGPDTVWAIEERIDPRASKAARKVWRLIVESCVSALQKTTAELGPPPGRKAST